MLLDRLALFDLGNNNLIGEPFERAYIACCLKAFVLKKSNAFVQCGNTNVESVRNRFSGWPEPISTDVF